jgi:uncharacterized repeat protein (TIGR02543 family)
MIAAMVCVGCNDKSPVNPDPNKPDVPDKDEYTLTVKFDTARGNVSISPKRDTYRDGDLVSVTANAKDGYGFAGWSGDYTDTDSAITITMSGDKELTANFGPTHTLSFLTPSNGTISPNPVKDDYVEGEHVTITATANPGYIFERWIGLSTSENTADSVVTITITDDREIGARFKRVYIVTINIEPKNAGIVEYYDDDHKKSYYDEGDTIRVIANPESGYEFSDWLVEPAETTHTKSNDLLTIVIGKEDVEVTAKFDTVTPLLTQGDE